MYSIDTSCSEKETKPLSEKVVYDEDYLIKEGWRKTFAQGADDEASQVLGWWHPQHTKNAFFPLPQAVDIQRQADMYW